MDFAIPSALPEAPLTAFPALLNTPELEEPLDEVPDLVGSGYGVTRRFVRLQS